MLRHHFRDEYFIGKSSYELIIFFNLQKMGKDFLFVLDLITSTNKLW